MFRYDREVVLLEHSEHEAPSCSSAARFSSGEESPEMIEAIGQQFGPYRLLRLLGTGNFASVYLGEHQYLERPAAIKVLRVRMGQEADAPFRREARTIAHLDHPCRLPESLAVSYQKFGHI